RVERVLLAAVEATIDLEVPARMRVQRDCVVLAEVADAVDVGEVLTLGELRVFEHRSGRADRGRMRGDAEAREILGAEMTAQPFPPELAIERERIALADHDARAPAEHRQGTGREDLARGQPRELAVERGRVRDLRDRELAAAEVQKRDPEPGAG